MNYKVQNLELFDPSILAGIKDNQVELTAEYDYATTSNYSVSVGNNSGYRGHVIRIGNRLRFIGQEPTNVEQVLDLLISHLEDDPIAVYSYNAAGVEAIEADYKTIFENLTEEYYEFYVGQWIQHKERINPTFELYLAFKLLESYNKHYLHIELKQELIDSKVEKEYVFTVNGIPETLESQRHFPINNINERVITVEIPEADLGDFNLTRTEKIRLWESDSQLYEKYGVSEHPITKLWTSVIDNKSDKLLVTFPGFGGEKYNYPISTFKAVEDYSKLVFADVYGNKGSYLSVDNDGVDLEPRVIEKIKQVMEQLNITEENVVFTGISKGASAAIKFGNHFPSSQIYAICPQLDIERFTRNFLLMNVFLKNSQRKYPVDYNRPNINLYVAESDKPSHQNRKFEDFDCNLTILPGFPHIEGGYHAATRVVNLLQGGETVVVSNQLELTYEEATESIIECNSKEVLYAELQFTDRKFNLSLDTENNAMKIIDSRHLRNMFDAEILEEADVNIMYITTDGVRHLLTDIKLIPEIDEQDEQDSTLNVE